MSGVVVPNRGWIGVDLDGTLAKYDSWRGAEHIGDPVPAMLLRVRRWLVKGEDVRIVTARVGPQGDHHQLARARLAIELWCKQHIGRILPVTAAKDFAMRVLYDDRAVQVETNTGRLIGAKEE